MTLLLDTHAFLWAVMQPDKLSAKVRRLLESPDTRLLISAASAWEIATKYRLGRLPAAKPILSGFDDVIRRLDAQVMAISHTHALHSGGYTLEHADPFDRMLAAQSELERIPLVSRDKALQPFPVELVW